MKNVITKIFAPFAIVALISLSACEKENENNQVALGKATITGKIQVDLALNNNLPDVTYDKIPSSTKVFAKINSKDLVINAGTGTYADIYYPVTVNADGTYSVTVDANVKDVTITFVADDFRADQLDAGGKAVSKIFSLQAASVVVVKDITKVKDLMFQ